MNSEKRKIRVTIICVVCALFIAVALRIHHSNHAVDALLDRADSLLAVGEADSAMTLLDSLAGGDGGGSPSPLGEARRGRFHLLQADAMNKTYRPFTTDSILKEVVRYYDRHGTPNERLRARYLLGCAYRDMGESPQAIFTWENALTAADTISANCDFGTLVAICSQLADVYHAKLLFLQEIHCLHTSSNYSFKDGDTIYAIDNLRRIGSCYTMLNKDDSAEYYYRRAQTLYRKYGFTQAALLSSTPLIYLYLRQGQLLKAKVLMDRYESEFEEFSNNHELPPRRRQYFCYKAYYYEQQEQLDSAEIFYRKAFRPKMDYISRSPIYAGLLRVYQQLGLADSIVKYAQLYCTVNDSALAVSDRELTAQAAASYNYTRSQNEAISQRERASALAIALTTLTALLLVIATITIAVVRRNRERRKRQSIQIARLKHDLHTTQAEYAIQEQSLTQMQTLYTSSMELLRNDVNKLHRENEEDKNKLRDYQRQLNAMSAAYEENITMLSTDIERKRRRIETLEHLLDKNETSQTLADFENTEIVRHIKDMVANYEQMTRHDCNALIKAGNIHYPQLMEDLRNNRGITSRAIQVCLLLLICDRVEDIANLMGVKGSRVTNLKGDISLALFG